MEPDKIKLYTNDLLAEKLINLTSVNKIEIDESVVTLFYEIAKRLKNVNIKTYDNYNFD